MNLVRLLGLALAALVLVVGCGNAANTSQQPAGAPGAADDAATHTRVTGAEQLQFTAKTIENETFSGQSLVGKPAVLWFWTPWCPTCQREAPVVAEVAQANPQVTFLGVAAQDEVAAMQNFVAKYKVDSFTHLADGDAEVWQRFGVTVQPAYAFMGADGSVDVVKGTLPEQELTERVSALASE